MSTAHAMNWVPTETFGTRLAMLRRQLGWNQKQAAESCGIDDASWSNWERGVSTPRDMSTVVRKVHDATGVDMAWLMWGSTPSDGGFRSSACITAGNTDAQVIPFRRITARVRDGITATVSPERVAV